MQTIFELLHSLFILLLRDTPFFGLLSQQRHQTSEARLVVALR